TDRARGHPSRRRRRRARAPGRAATPAGRLDEAEALFCKAEPHPLARLGEAALALERGRPLEAGEAPAAVAERYGGRLSLERAAALELPRASEAGARGDARAARQGRSSCLGDRASPRGARGARRHAPARRRLADDP